jgi:cation diffusion facilitator CzcD-associated flavoprotein CzcO
MSVRNGDLGEEKTVSRYRVAIIGAGFSGICVAIRLLGRKENSFIMFEKAGEIGGTWRDNTYPGVACDVPSHLYSYSFERNPEWSREYAPGQEIKAYLDRCARKYDLHSRIRFNTQIQEARYLDGEWELRTAANEVIRCNVLIAAMGGLHNAYIPDVPGIDSFAGKAFHTSNWDHDLKLEGRRVAIIGTGASAVQCIPHVAERADHLTVFQRTPIWVLPKRDPVFSDDDKRRFRDSAWWSRLYRYRIWKAWEGFGVDVIRDTERNRSLQTLGVKFIRSQVKDPDLAARLTPDYRYGCKRPTMSNDYYKAFNRENVELVTDGLASLEREGARTDSGRLVKVDTIIWATGFRPFDISADMKFYGRDGTLLSDVWRSRIFSYRTMMVPKFPNFMVMLGPNSGGLTSAIQMIEAQAGYVVKVLRYLKRRNLVAVEPKENATESWNRTLQEGFTDTIANSGCRSWWTGGTGYNHTQYPHSSLRYRLELAVLRPGEFIRRGR